MKILKHARENPQEVTSGPLLGTYWRTAMLRDFARPCAFFNQIKFFFCSRASRVPFFFTIHQV